MFRILLSVFFSACLAYADTLLGSNTANLTSTVFCPVDYTVVGDQCLMFLTFAEEPYHEARQVCHAANGELATVTTATQLKNIVDHIKTSGFTGRKFWLDGTDEAEEGKWVTSSGQAVPRGTPFWAAGMTAQQPDNYGGNEHCLELTDRMYFYMNDAACEVKRNFICESITERNVRTTLGQAPSPIAKSGCPTFYAEVGGLCLMFVTWADVIWEEAAATCGDSGELLAITDIETLRAVYLYLHQENINAHSFWLGGSDSVEEGNWIYTTGEPVPMSTPFWGIYDYESGVRVQEPQGGTDENCLALDSAGSHNFRDGPCSAKKNPLCVHKE